MTTLGLGHSFAKNIHYLKLRGLRGKMNDPHCCITFSRTKWRSISKLLVQEWSIGP